MRENREDRIEEEEEEEEEGEEEDAEIARIVDHSEAVPLVTDADIGEHVGDIGSAGELEVRGTARAGGLEGVEIGDGLHVEIELEVGLLNLEEIGEGEEVGETRVADRFLELDRARGRVTRGGGARGGGGA